MVLGGLSTFPRQCEFLAGGKEGAEVCGRTGKGVSVEELCKTLGVCVSLETGLAGVCVVLTVTLGASLVLLEDVDISLEADCVGDDV